MNDIDRMVAVMQAANEGKAIQSQNRRDNNLVTFNGRTECLTEWARITGLNRTTIRKRINIGWSVEAALTTPLTRERRSAAA